MNIEQATQMTDEFLRCSTTGAGDFADFLKQSPHSPNDWGDLAREDPARVRLEGLRDLARLFAEIRLSTRISHAIDALDKMILAGKADESLRRACKDILYAVVSEPMKVVEADRSTDPDTTHDPNMSRGFNTSRDRQDIMHSLM